MINILGIVKNRVFCDNKEYWVEEIEKSKRERRKIKVEFVKEESREYLE